jgi:hypothetical protein
MAITSRSAKPSVGDVAAADHADLVVGGEGLVMHAPVEAAEVGEVAEHARSAVDEGVVQAQLDVRVRVERGEHRVEPGVVGVVDQQAHAHAAFGGLPHRLPQQRADRVAVPDEVLHVERAFRQAGEQHAGREGIVRVFEWHEAGQARMLRQPRRHRLAQPGLRGVGQRLRLDAVGRQRRRRATGQQPEEGDEDEDRQAAIHDHGLLRSTGRPADCRRPSIMAGFPATLRPVHRAAA